MASLANDWLNQFLQQVQEPSQADQLKEASLNGQLADWTQQTTTAVVKSCESFGWRAAARRHRLDLLPETGEEYLGIDVMAFSGDSDGDHGSLRWPLPVAIFELENSPRADRVAYSLWKVLCVRAELRLVFAYRQDWEQTRQLVNQLTTDVVAGFSPEQRLALKGETALVTGSRGEGETFPYGYFKFWLLNANLGKFDRI